ncbi:hypothetical protein PHSY_004986 [Pseudozyma hubeiensis SY62]|uniref:Uncharacterized protein n=1 Tax=Pseudozyma hubeiensis (strain SY62) TaxID=1305764 RepID=R9P7S3_PSEHS|nr:hypothetical protein PHSY_004986 [Pseudozyma hubeiensis SY62]GAC97401.1 hypothetical protein PHSY_004986 [Pseudozyma hubeiensis SY62]
MVPSHYAAPPHKKRRYGDHGSSSTQDDSFGVQSLPVAILADDFSGDPNDGEEYLAVVRREAAAAPGVFFAAHNPYASITEASPPSQHTVSEHGPADSIASAPSQNRNDTDDRLIMPISEWRTTFVEQFKNAREALSNPPLEPVKLTRDDLPKLSNTAAWYAWIHGRPPPATSSEEAEKQASRNYEWRIREPSASLLLRLSTEQMLALLEAFPYWIAHRVPIPDGQVKASERQGGEVLQPLHARWLFALLLRLDGRLVSEEISMLRTLARACVAAITLSRIRRKAVRSRVSKLDAVETVANDDEKRMRLDEAGAWMVVAIIAGVWGQSDLWDDAVVDMQRVTS